MIDAFLQRSLKVGKGLAGAAEAHVFADVVSAFRAARTLLARDADFEGYLVAGLEVGDGGSHGDDDT